MTTMRKRHSAAFKAKIVQELLNDERPHQALAYRVPAEVYFGSQHDQDEQIKSTLKGEKSTLIEASILS